MGGRLGAIRLSSVERYDPLASAWEPVAAMGAARSAHGAAVLDGKLYVAGGNADNDSSKSVERYDPATNTWEVVAAMPMDHPWAYGCLVAVSAAEA